MQIKKGLVSELIWFMVALMTVSLIIALMAFGCEQDARIKNKCQTKCQNYLNNDDYCQFNECYTNCRVALNRIR